jgi:hypothetical protein
VDGGIAAGGSDTDAALVVIGAVLVGDWAIRPAPENVRASRRNRFRFEKCMVIIFWIDVY